MSPVSVRARRYSVTVAAASARGYPAGMDRDNPSFRLARFLAGTPLEAIPETVRHEGRRALLNHLACAIAGSGAPVIAASLALEAGEGTAGPCRIAGLAARAGPGMAAFANAAAANIFDYDDTHLPTVIHPTAPVAPPLFALAECGPLSGADLLRAFLLGVEAECRIGLALGAGHYAAGWHITATCGIFGAAGAVGVLRGLDAEALVLAFSHAAAQASGMVAMLGTDSKSLGVGNAARNGLASALLAAGGGSGADDPLGGDRGFLALYGRDAAPAAITDGLGADWQIMATGYKPYPAGIVLHPVIEACLALYHEDGLRAADVAELELRGHPLLRQRTDRPDVADGRLAQVSAQHAIAIALMRGRAGLAEFSDEAVGQTAATGLRPAVRFIDEDGRDIASVALRLTTRQGREFRREIAIARGTPSRPLSDGALEEKLAEAFALAGLAGDPLALADAVWRLEDSADAARPMRLAVPR